MHNYKDPKMHHFILGSLEKGNFGAVILENVAKNIWSYNVELFRAYVLVEYLSVFLLVHRTWLRNKLVLFDLAYILVLLYANKTFDIGEM